MLNACLKSTPMPHIAPLLQSAIGQGFARIDAQMLMLHACGRSEQDRAWLIAHDQEALSDAQFTLWQAALKRRLAGEPVAYIVGYKEFYGLRLKVTADVLDPRDDTETLVDWALELIPQSKPFKVLDLGTGSGAVALALSKQRPLAQVTATDASVPALAVAKLNAEALDLPVRFVLADAQDDNWFSSLGDERFDLIVSNPPYIAEGDVHLAALHHEPAMALTSGTDGLDAIHSITAHATKHLIAGGWLLFEHGHDQAAAVTQVLGGHGFQQIATRQDLSSVDRSTGALRPW
jgi:release factor glutamine methyltransferase